jgi:hypothetical protein
MGHDNIRFFAELTIFLRVICGFAAIRVPRFFR